MRVEDQRDFLLKHARHPSHVGDPRALTHQGACKNPLCGDAVDVGVEIEGDRIRHIAIRASGCGISTASASLMAEEVKGLKVEECLQRLAAFERALVEPASKEGSAWPQEISTLEVFSRLRESPTRVPCALIGWFAFKEAVKSSIKAEAPSFRA